MRTICMILVTLLVFAGTAQGQSVWMEQVKLLASDGVADDGFGYSVSISGDFAIVGVVYDDDSGDRSGSAYIFKWNGTSWIEQQKLLASDGAASDYFGESVSISGDLAIVGAKGNDDKGDKSGSAYIFKWNGTSWIEQQKLLASDGSSIDYFGVSVSICGDLAIVGAYGDDSWSGSAYIFKWDGTSWVQQQKLLASDRAANDCFGTCVSIDGDFAIVGAYHNDDNGANSGSAYIFRWDGTNWIEQKLLPSDGAADDQFGSSVSISGDFVIVGAYQDGDNGIDSGSAYIFKWDGTSWIEQQKLLASDGAADDQFGSSVSISGDYLIIGSIYDDDNGTDSGSAYIFKWNGTSWIEQQKFLASDGAASDYFGANVSISGNLAIAGARWHDDNGTDSGSAYIFRTPVMWHVDCVNGDNNNNGRSRETAFVTIQKGIEKACDADTVLVWPGVYNEVVDFAGKAITVQSAADAAVITNVGGYGARFHTAEGAGSVLANFVIRDCNIGIQAESSSPTIDNVTVVNNTQGIVADGIADPIITNSILWDNESGDLIDCDASDSYSEDDNSHYVTQWGSYGSGDGQFNAPRYTAVGFSHVYVTDGQNDRIQKFTNSGDFVLEWGTGGNGDAQFAVPQGIAIDSLGYVYVADDENSRIQKFTSNGDFVTKWGTYGSADGQFKYTMGVAVDTSGYVYVVDHKNHRIQKFTSNGDFVTKWGTYGSADGQFRDPMGIAVDASGYVYVADPLNYRIQVFTSNGDFVTKWNNSGSSPAGFRPYGVATDFTGSVYVSDHDNHRMLIFTNNGDYITSFGTNGSGDGQFYSPYGLSIDTSGNIYVADTGNHRIQKFMLPQFADPAGGNYHLKSEQGRFWPEDPTDPNEFGLFDGLWAMDSVTSPCIDAGDPTIDPSGEGEYSGGRVNMGAYGGTAYASRSDYYWPLEGDVNRDGIVNLADFAIVSENWLDSLP